jgi:glutamate carboxypeptidase
MILKPFASAALFLCMSGAGAAQLSPVEQKIVAEVKAHSAQGLQLLERSVNINSGTMNHEGVREVGKVFREQFDQLGF